jgi:hypothetical protein
MSIWEATLRVIGPGAPSDISDGAPVGAALDAMVRKEGSEWPTRGWLM